MAFYRWRMDCYERRSQCDHQVAKYERRGQRSWSKTNRMPYGEYTLNVGDVVEMGSQGDRVSRPSIPQSGWRDGDPVASLLRLAMRSLARA